MKKNDKNEKPVLGQTYRIVEWDDSTDRVVVVHVFENGDINMQYPDEVRHRVTPSYFFETLKATKVIGAVA